MKSRRSYRGEARKDRVSERIPYVSNPASVPWSTGCCCLQKVGYTALLHKRSSGRASPSYFPTNPLCHSGKSAADAGFIVFQVAVAPSLPSNSRSHKLARGKVQRRDSCAPACLATDAIVRSMHRPLLHSSKCGIFFQFCFLLPLRLPFAFSLVEARPIENASAQGGEGGEANLRQLRDEQGIACHELADRVVVLMLAVEQEEVGEGLRREGRLCPRKERRAGARGKRIAMRAKLTQST